VSGNHDSRAQLLGLATFPADDLAKVSAPLVDQPDCGPGLPDVRSGGRRTLQQQRIQAIPPQSPAPCVAHAYANPGASPGTRHVRGHGMIARKQSDLAHVRAGQFKE
jgi:hypothetical protein